jgi:hypothetical protein
MHHRVFRHLPSQVPLLFALVLVPSLKGAAAQQAGAGQSAAQPPGGMQTLAGFSVAGVQPSVTNPSSANDPNTLAEAAVKALSIHVSRMSHPEALRTAFRAYHNYRAAHSDLVRKPYLYFVDFGLAGAAPRGYVFDMQKLTIVDGPFPVAHGRGSARARSSVPTLFSNRAGSLASSLGLYLAQETYSFSGRSGGRAYRSVGLRMRGESGAFNNAARRRGIVAHGAPYVSAGGAGRSEGCPAMEPRRAQRLLPLIANGGVVFIYSPNDARWLRQDPWINT